MSSLKRLLYKVLPGGVMKMLQPIFEKKEMTEEEWIQKGKPFPPPHTVKQRTIVEYQKKHNAGVLVETGTFRGDMVNAQKNSFRKVISIELSKELHEKAKQRFKNDKNVLLFQGDSGHVMGDVMKEVNETAVFWLDGHYMPGFTYKTGVTAKGEKECPVFEEIDAVFKGSKLNHVILIDDARLFVGKYDYPTVDELTKFVKERNSKYGVEVKDDIIRYEVK